MIRTPMTEAGREALAAIVSAPERAVLAFDFDGVLAPIVPDPDQAVPHPAAVPALTRLAGLVKAIVVISGRPAAVVVDRAALRAVPELAGLTVFGHYGAERWDAATGEVTADPPHPGVREVRAALPQLLDRLNAPAQVWIEDKGRAIAVHTRRCPDPVAAFDLLKGPIAGLAAEHGLILEPGRLVLEVRPPGVDKGQALRRFVAEHGAAAVAYFGDDLGDLAAFAAVEQLRSGGVPGIKVGSGSPEVVEIANRADVVVDGPNGVIDLVGVLADEIEAAHPRSGGAGR